jgi:hypothetical protein
VLKEKILIDDRSHIVNTDDRSLLFVSKRDGKKRLKEEKNNNCHPFGDPLGGTHG